MKFSMFSQPPTPTPRSLTGSPSSVMTWGPDVRSHFTRLVLPGFSDAALEIAAFRGAGGEVQGAAVGGAGFRRAAQAAQQFAAGGVPVLVSVEVERVDDGE